MRTHEDYLISPAAPDAPVRTFELQRYAGRWQAVGYDPQGSLAAGTSWWYCEIEARAEARRLWPQAVEV